MNKRLILIDQEETPGYIAFYGCGLGNEIHTLQSIELLSDDEKKNLLSLGDGDAVMLVGAEPFKYLQQFYHYGIRSENYFDCSKLRRLSIEGGAYAKCINDFPEPEVIADFMSQDFAQHRDFSWFKQKVLHTYQEVIRFFDWLDSLPKETDFGFDYEASGMPWDKWFELSGASVCTVQYGGFISFTDLRHNCTKEEYNYILFRLGKFLVDRMEHVWTYNMSYEFQVSHRMLGVDLYNLCDASVYNVLDGNHLKKYSLKWTANMIIQSQVWDTEFDWISDTIDSMLFETVGKLKKDKQKILKISKDNFKDTPEWKAICQRYPSYENEFESLILEYWGNPFMCIPSEILGYYCNLDAFYTLMIHEDRKQIYSEKAINTFMDNIRLQTRLHSIGINKWESYRQEYEIYCQEQMAWGITYCAEARCKVKMIKHKEKAANISKYNPICRTLLKKGKFFNGDPLEITKCLLIDHLDTMDAYDTGINEGALLMSYGSEFAEPFMEIIRDAMKEVKMKGKIDDGIVRKKKILGIIATKLSDLLELGKIKIGDKHIELEKYLYYERAYKELMKVSKSQLYDVHNIPSEIYAFGQKFNLLDYSNYVSDNYFKCKSPIENDEICLEFAKLFQSESAYLAAILESTQQLHGADKFYQEIGINTIEDAFAHFMKQWQQYCMNQGDLTGIDYPEKIFTLASEFWGNPASDQVKEVWSNFNGYTAQSQFFKYVDSQYEAYGEVFNEDDMNENFFFMRKLVLNYLLFKKYSKVLSTYIDGMFTQTDKWVIEDPNTHIVLREADPDEPGAVRKMFARFQCMEKSSKRWSSGYHTIISHSDIKSTVSSYPGCLLTYFDISSAEVKSAGFQSQDPDLIDKFVNGIDIYIYTAKLYLQEEGWNALSDKDKKMWRKRFKTIFLGILYGLGKASLAARLNCSEEEAEIIIQAVYKAFPKLREYVASQQRYPLEHDGCINTFFGDRLQVDEWKWYKKAKTSREKKNLEARISRLGVNLPIQGGTSTAMSSGFFNDLRVAKESGWNLTSFITVHDSNTCNLPADKVWEIRKFYDTNFTDFCYGTTGIKLLFDLEVGSNYNDSASMKQIDDTTVEFKGTARSILFIMDRMNECPGLQYETDIPRDEIIPAYVEDPFSRFIQEKGCSFVMDKSKYVVRFKKLSV